MALQWHPVAWLYLAATLISWTLAYRLWFLRPARGANFMILIMVCAGIWAGAEVIIILFPDLSFILTVTKFQYTGIIGAPLFWILFTIQYSRYDHWLTQRNIGLLAAIPVLHAFIVLTLDWHNLLYERVGMTTVDGILVFDRDYGISFWIWVGYSYAAVFIGSILLIQAVLRHPNLYRGQATTIIMGASAPVFFSILFFTGNNPLGEFDPNPIAYSVTGAFVTLSLLRYRFLDAVPVAYDLIFKNVNSGVLIMDQRGVVQDMNPFAGRIFDRNPEETIGHPLREFFAEYAQHLQDDIKTELQINNRTYEMQINAFRDRRNQPSGSIMLLYDITEQRRAISELDAYAHTVAHDLKNPLSNIILLAEMVTMFENEDLSEHILERITSIHDNAEKMNEIIDALLTFARIRRASDVELVTLDSQHIVESVLKRYQGKIAERMALIQRPQTWHAARGHAAWVEEIWANYISNAIKYGGETPLIKLGSDLQDDGMVRFWVKDNGAGMTEEQAHSLFTPSKRLEQHQNIEGHGFGLSIVQRIVERLGGTVGVDSVAGMGSTFYFTLPAAPSENTLSDDETKNDPDEPPAIQIVTQPATPSNTTG